MMDGEIGLKNNLMCQNGLGIRCLSLKRGWPQLNEAVLFH